VGYAPPSQGPNSGRALDYHTPAVGAGLRWIPPSARIVDDIFEMCPSRGSRQGLGFGSSLRRFETLSSVWTKIPKGTLVPFRRDRKQGPYPPA